MKCTNIAAVAAVAAILTGCAAGTSGTAATEDTSRESHADVTIMTIDANEEAYKSYIRQVEDALGLSIELVMPDQDANNREAQFSMQLSTGDSSVDIYTVNDEMLSEFKQKGYLEAIPEGTIPQSILESYPKEYRDAVSCYEGNLYAVPFYMDIYMLWVNQQYLNEAGMNEIEDLADFDTLLAAVSDGERYGYGGAWEKTYSYNDIYEFINMFGGDINDWSNERTRAALSYMHDMVADGHTETSQLIDQFDQVMQKMIDGKYAAAFLYSGSLHQVANLGAYGDDALHVVELPDFGARQTNMAAWSYVVNASSQHKDAVWKVLAYMSSDEGTVNYCNAMHRPPARQDILQQDLDIPDIDIMRQYAEDCVLKPRAFAEDPMFGVEMIGELFGNYITDEITLEEFCEQISSLELQ